MLDGTLSKDLKITERVKVELKMAAYNAINRLNRGNPNMGVTSSQFGQALYQGTPSATFGPQTHGIRERQRPASRTRDEDHLLIPVDHAVQRYGRR